MLKIFGYLKNQKSFFFLIKFILLNKENNMKTKIFTLLSTLFVFIFSSNVKAQDNLKTYNNYDFIPGEKVLFEDDFHDAQDGEFPPRWKLISNQGVVNAETGGEKYFTFTESSVGSMGRVEPRIKTKSYLKTAFTVEFDFWLPEDEMIGLYFRETGDEGKFISIESDGTIKTNYFNFETQLNGIIPDGKNMKGKWYHAAFAYKNQQIKCYINQDRVLVIPNCEFTPIAVIMGGSLNARMKNFKLADGGGMNMLNKILTDGKFVSHAIKFDVAKSTIKGESMGFINELGKWLKDNPTIKLQVDGHTDSDGDLAANQKLSEDRAEAVRKTLTSLGVDASRLKSKGFGETKPSSPNDTPEGKADNRRVEFVKI